MALSAESYSAGWPNRYHCLGRGAGGRCTKHDVESLVEVGCVDGAG